LHNVPDSKGLVVKSLGFATKQLKVNGGDSINVSLEPSVNVLAEVAVSKPSPNNNDDRSSGNTGVHPSAGWKALNDYLDKNASTANGRTGKVILSFTVDGRGSISGFKITQSLSNAADQKAMDLISNGPAWAGNIDGQPHEVTVTVSFH
jgi:TonB family protein